ncbi:MAG TPA: hypothetical protein VE972_11990 [Conexibacter sp.]|nr:hypothetical protein [Conexibacter sp.]
MEDRRRVLAATLAIGLTLLALGLVVTLSQTAARRTGTDGTSVTEALAVTSSDGTFCQPRELVPAGTGAVRLSLKATTRRSSTVAVAVMRGRTTLARGARTSRWSGEQLDVPLRSTLHADVVGRICVTLGGHAPIALGGMPTGTKVAARTGRQALSGRLRIEYLRPGRESWWSLASTVAHRITIGHPLPGSPAALLAVLLTLASILVGSWQLVRRAT